MKLKFFSAIFFTFSVAFSADDAAVIKIQEKKDFSLICAIAKSAEMLSKDKFITDKAERVGLTTSMLDTGIKSDEVKKVLKAVSLAEPTQKIKILKMSAAEVGLKHWYCSPLKYLF